MELRELLTFVEIEYGRLEKYYGRFDQEKNILIRTVKLT